MMHDLEFIIIIYITIGIMLFKICPENIKILKYMSWFDKVYILNSLKPSQKITKVSHQTLHVNFEALQNHCNKLLVCYGDLYWDRLLFKCNWPNSVQLFHHFILPSGISYWIIRFQSHDVINKNEINLFGLPGVEQECKLQKIY